MSDEYEVGYRKPPVHTRFQKGRSGNPGGRPGPKKARRRLLAQMLEAGLLKPGEKGAMTFCEAAEREVAAEPFRNEVEAGSPVSQCIIEESPRMRGRSGR